MNTCKFKLITVLLFICYLSSGCQWLKTQDYNDRFGPAHPINRTDSHVDGKHYAAAREVLDKRCVVCHACYDAPCQLKLNSLAGIDRGASKRKVYQSRVLLADTSRLFKDGLNTTQWRDKGFFPVLNERRQTPEANLELSLLYQLLAQKRANPLTHGQALDDSIDVSIKREQSCPKIEEYDSYAERFPLQGMPFGLPAISQHEHNSVKHWIMSGASAPLPEPLNIAQLSAINRWETFFNQTDLQSKLVARYIYEHLYLANLYFSDIDETGSFYKLVRSYTPSGSAIRVISSRRPFDSPGTASFYYRLQRVESSTVVKTHLPYALNQSRYDFWQQIFFSEDFKITKLPSYKTHVSANPFIAFAELPIYARYKFMLEEAQFTIMNYIKGPVCRGQVALDVINDNFWVMFTNPEIYKTQHHDSFYADNAELLRFPAHWGAQGSLFSWPDLAKRSADFMQARSDYLKKVTPHFDATMNSLVWDGYQQQNKNAALTIFRHFDSATVVKGFAGSEPKTAWLIGYGLLERIHYLLVAGFDVNGTIQHQLTTRLYMEFLRMEGEATFISMLPKAEQAKTVSAWNIDPGDSVETYFKSLLDDGKGFSIKHDYLNPDNAVSELLTAIKQHTGSMQYPIKPNTLSKYSVEKLQALNHIKGKVASFFPEASFMQITAAQSQKTQWFTLLRHSSHKNLSHLLSEQDTRTPDNDQLNILPHFFSAYPNRFIAIHERQISAFMQDIKKAETQAEFDKMLTHYAVSRTSLDFWPMSDDLHQSSEKVDGLNYGLFDYNRLQHH